MFVVVYNPNTGEITSRISCTDMQMLIGETWLEISENVFFSKPETKMKVDLDSLTLMPK